MRIVLISEVFARNMGYLENILPKYLARLGAEVDVIACSLAPNYRQDPRRETYRNFHDAIPPGSVETLEGFRLHVVGHTRTLGHVRLLGLDRKLGELRPHIVQTMTPIGWIAVDAAVNRMRLGYRLFSGCHYHASVFPLAQKQAGPLDPERLRCLAERGAHGRAASWLTEKCYAISPDCAEVAARFFGVPRKKIEICPLGVDTEMFHPICGRDEVEARNELRHRLGFREEEIVCVYSGRFTPDKNPLLLARAVAELNQAGEPFRGLFVGHGNEGEEIARCAGCVVHPFVPVGELAAFYRASDIAVWPAQESMSMLDAAACGRPVIANDRMGDAERLTGCGLQYCLCDARDLAEKIRSLRSAAVREGLGSRGAWRMQEEYSWEAIAARRLADYSAALAGRGTSAVAMHLTHVAAQESLAAWQTRQDGRQDGSRR
jgi:glycosyltransferase involved in cell wall biosynthesis